MALNTTLPSPIRVRQTNNKREWTWWNVSTGSIWKTIEEVTETVDEYVALTLGAAQSGLSALAGDEKQVVLDEDNRVIRSYKLTVTTETKSRTYEEV